MSAKRKRSKQRRGLAGAFVVVGLVLALLGLWWSWRHARAEGVALLVAFLVTGPAATRRSSPPSGAGTCSCTPNDPQNLAISAVLNETVQGT
jgi:hypothetical protein